MTDQPEVPATQFWWLHDARWYQGVARRFGQQAANEVNAEAARFVARRFAEWYAHAHGVPNPPDATQLARALAGISATMFAPAAMAVTNEVAGPDAVRTEITRNFALKMLRAAGTLDGYECPCLDLRAGWFEGLGARVAGDRCEDCLRTGGPACRFRVELSPGEVSPDAVTPPGPSEAD